DFEGKTALHIAVDGGFYDCVTILLQYGADVNICDQFGRTPLHWVPPHACAAIIDTLYSHKAELEARDILGWTPLYIGTPHPNMKYSDEDYLSEDEYMGESDGEIGSNEDVNESEASWETYEDEDSDSESSTGSFQDAVEAQEVADLIAGVALSEPALDHGSDDEGAVAGP
ncbi:ankyrin repeat-containing domain protein, partial [Rhexocercosporidium sp. MPI-PUGE-AT-0058]